MGLIDRTLPPSEAADGFGSVFPTGETPRAAALRAVIAISARLSSDCPPMLVPGLLIRLAEAAGTDPADSAAAAGAARSLSAYLAEHAIPLFALPETSLVLGDDAVHMRLSAINAAMARLESLVGGLEGDARRQGAPANTDAPVWHAIGLGEARVRRGILSSARLRSRLTA